MAAGTWVKWVMTPPQSESRGDEPNAVCLSACCFHVSQPSVCLGNGLVHGWDVCVFLLHCRNQAHCPHMCPQRPVSWVPLGSVKLTVRTDHHNPLSDNDCLLYTDSPPLLVLYAPASHAHYPPLLLTGLNQITLPFHTFLIWLLHFYTPGKRAKAFTCQKYILLTNELWPGRSPLKGT